MKNKLNSIQKFKRKIQRVFSENPKSLLNYKQIASKLGMESGEDKNTIITVLNVLKREGILDEIRPGKYAALFKHQFVFGRMDLTQRGSGFVIPDADSNHAEDIFISSDMLNTALDGDRVKVHLFAHQNNGKASGEVVEIVQRRQMEFPGVVQLNHGYAFVVPDDKKMYSDIFIPGDKINKAKQGDKVIARIIEWKIGEKNPFGEIVSVLGKPGEHNAEMHAIVANFGFAIQFPPEVQKECSRLPHKIAKSDLADRLDFRDIVTFTIDPEDAKDFDDALSFRKTKHNTFEIGIHIADVSHYVQPGTAIDREAYERGTSVYLVDRTIPMLPEVLSNDLCSLRPHEDKLTFSVLVELNQQAEILNYSIAKTIIHSQRRFTYEEAQHILETGAGEYSEELIQLNQLAKILQGKRFAQGAISFESQEVKFKLDEQFRPVDVFVKVRKDAHKLIEEFMLLANRIVAEQAGKKDKGKRKNPFVYRVHEEPSDDKLQNFSRFITRFGYSIPQLTASNASRNLNQFLTDVEGKPEQNLLQGMAIRTMQKAFYTSKKHGHYGLAFDFYTHFTSPIRRYPDLIAHRLIYTYLQQGQTGAGDELERACEHASAMEARAAEAERASVRYKQVEYIRDYIGDTFTGIISGITEWGIYVEITRFRCEGMIRLQSLDDDYYEFDERNQWIIGRYSKRRFQLGDSIEVIVAAADLQKRQIDFEIAQKVVNRKNAKKIQEKARKEGRKKKRR